MNLQQLRVLAAVVEQRSFTRAAEHLAITQPAVSQHIRALERYCRLPLFERRGSRVVPTPAGQELYRQATRLLQAYGQVERVVIELRSNPSVSDSDSLYC